MVVTFREKNSSWSNIAAEANSKGLGSWTASTLRSWWHRNARGGTVQRLRRQRKLRQQLAELAETEHSPSELARMLRQRGHRSLEGHRLGRAHVYDMLKRYGIERGVRPFTRADCPEQRPCWKVGCRYHLALEVDFRGRLRFAPIRLWEVTPQGQAHGLPDVEAGDLFGLPETCALDISDREALHLEAIGEVMNLTRERVRQVLQEALAKVGKQDERLHTWLLDVYERTKTITRTRDEMREAIASDPRQRRSGQARRDYRRTLWKRRKL